MAKTTLLDIVQDILSDSDGDEVNSISDTVESDQAARIVRSEYNIIVDEFDIKMHESLTKLDATGATTPAAMTRPEGAHSIEWIKYDRRTTAGGDPRFETVSYREPTEFIELTARRTASDSEVETMALGASGYDIQIRNDQAPQWWTILEGYDTIIFDSYDSNLETNLQQSKSLCRVVQRPALALTDAAVPDLPENLMILLKNRARAFYFDVFKDGVTREVDKRQRNSEVRSQRKKYVTKKLQQERTGPNFGRRGHRTHTRTTRP
jgi:hypothetical protein